MSEEERSVYAPPASGTRCALCHEGLEAHSAAWTCHACGTLVHAECTSELKRCPTLGCGGVLPSGEHALEYHEMLEQRDGWFLRRLPILAATLGGLIGGFMGLVSSEAGFSPVRDTIQGALFGMIGLGLGGTAFGFFCWEVWRKLSSAREPWD